MKTTADFENDIIGGFSNFFSNYSLKSKIPKKSSYTFSVDDDRKNEYTLKRVILKENDINNNFYVVNNILQSKPNNLFIEEIIKTKEEENFIVVNDATYITYKNIDGESLSLDNKEDLSLYFSFLYDIHGYLKNIDTTVFDDSKKIDLDIHKYTSDFYKIKKQVQNNKKKSSFDFEFLKNFGQLKKHIESIESNLSKIEGYTNRKYTVVLNDNSIYKHNEKALIKTPETFTLGYYIIDIYTFILKYLKKTTIDDIKGFDSILALYNSNMSSDEKEILKLLLQYPFKYINIMLQYYEKKRSFVPSYIKSELDEFKIQEEKIIKLLNL